MEIAKGQRNFDVLVIGSGIAGLSAAVAAATAGAKVAIIERADEEEYGGNTRWTEAYFRINERRTCLQRSAELRKGQPGRPDDRCRSRGEIPRVRRVRGLARREERTRDRARVESGERGHRGISAVPDKRRLTPGIDQQQEDNPMA
jgi:glycine/D-amino acid oxidase-like deaminating enzyme